MRPTAPPRGGRFAAPRGFIFGTLFRLVGRPIFDHREREVIANQTGADVRIADLVTPGMPFLWTKEVTIARVAQGQRRATVTPRTESGEPS